MNNSFPGSVPSGAFGGDDFCWPAAAEFVPPKGISSWPRITVVTPSFNQGRYLEATIRSVLSQNYPNLEYMVIDGGSRDNSLEILHQYSPWLAYWCSEKDHGQPHALNKSLARATGEFFNWINSDDLLAPGALFRVAELSRGGADLIAGVCANFDAAGRQTLVANSGLAPAGLILGRPGSVFHQPALWWRLAWINRCGGIDERFDLAFDYELLLRYLHLRPAVTYTDGVLAAFRLHLASKTCSQAEAFAPERERILGTLLQRADVPDLHRLCRRRLGQLRWWREVQGIVNRHPGLRFADALELAAKAFADPRVRLNRFTLGAIRKIVFESP